MATKLLDIGVAGRQRIDRYELVGEIASGGMATVFLARLTGVGGFQRFVAIKRLHPHLAGEQEFVQMFLDEARLAAGIHHPNVVPILEVGASPLGYYLVMEYIEGDTLARLLARAATSRRRMPLPIGLRITLDMLAGLHAAHELRDETGQPTNLVHRDVSPQNVLVGADGVSRITDFGVARAATRLSETRVGQLKGKIAYMAPEQAMGAEEVDRRADVFSSGIVIWEVLSAKRLFKADNDAATLSRLISDRIPALPEVSPDVGPNLSAVVAKALERDPERRFSSCAQFAEALEEAGAADTQVGSSRDLSTYVSEVIGNEIAQQRDAVRAWLARTELSQTEVPEKWPTAATQVVMLGGGDPRSGVTTHPGTPANVPTSVTIVTRSSPVPLVIALGAVAALLVVVIILLVERGREAEQSIPPLPQDMAASEIGQPGGETKTGSEAKTAEDAAAPSQPDHDFDPTPLEALPDPKASKTGGGTRRAQTPRADAKETPPQKRPEEPDLRNPYR